MKREGRNILTVCVAVGCDGSSGSQLWIKKDSLIRRCFMYLFKAFIIIILDVTLGYLRGAKVCIQYMNFTNGRWFEMCLPVHCNCQLCWALLRTSLSKKLVSERYLLHQLLRQFSAGEGHIQLIERAQSLSVVMALKSK